MTDAPPRRTCSPAALALGLALANVGRVHARRARRCGARRARSSSLVDSPVAAARARWRCCSRSRVVVGERTSRRARPQPAARRGRPGRPRGRRRDRTARAGPVHAPRAGPRADVRRASASTSRCSSSCRSGARRRRAPSSTRSSSCKLPPGPRRTGSTSARGFAATASTSCSRSTSGRRSARAAGSAASPIALRARLVRSIAPGLTGERRAVLEGIVLGDGVGALAGLCAGLPGLGALPHPRGERPERGAGRGGRVDARVAARDQPLGRRARGARRDRRLRAGGRPAAVGDPRRDRRRARVARLADGAAARRVAGAAARRRSRCSRGTRTSSTTRASSSRSRRSRRSSRSCRGSRERSRVTPLPRGLRLGVAVSLGCSLVTAPIVWLAVRLPAAARGSRECAGRAGDAAAARARVPRRRGSTCSRPGAAAVVAWLNGWVAAYIAAVRAGRSARCRSPRLRVRASSRCSSCSSPSRTCSSGGVLSRM